MITIGRCLSNSLSPLPHQPSVCWFHIQAPGYGWNLVARIIPWILIEHRLRCLLLQLTVLWPIPLKQGTRLMWITKFGKLIQTYKNHHQMSWWNRVASLGSTLLGNSAFLDHFALFTSFTPSPVALASHVQCVVRIVQLDSPSIAQTGFKAKNLMTSWKQIGFNIKRQKVLWLLLPL